MIKLARYVGLAALAALTVTLLPFASTVWAQGATTPAPSPALKPEYFTHDPYMSPPQISPDGTHMAWIEGNRLIIYDPADESTRDLPAGENAFDSVVWINNDYLAVYLKQEDVPQKTYVKVVGYSPLVVTKEGKFVRLLFEQPGKKLTAADLQPIIRYIDAPEPYVVTLSNNNSAMVDIATGKRKIGPRLMEGEYVFFDHEGHEQVTAEILDGKVSYGFTDITFRYRDRARGGVKTLKLPKQDKENIYYVNFNYSEFDDSIYWSEFNFTSGICTLYRYDLKTGEKVVFKTGTNKDLDLAFDDYGRIVGMTTVTDRVVTEWTDPWRLKVTGAVQKIFPKATVIIVDMSKDGQQIVFFISAPDAPDAYYYYSAASKELVEIGVNFPELDGQPLGEMTYVTYKARDGLEIPAYVTKRKDTPAGAPLVVIPHGGPAARDVYGFDYRAQYLASKGYVVLQPQYRGSAGFGDAFQRAGDTHLAQMTTDLEDGVKYLQAQGMIDPKKVCVFGWSWGGYLAQAALALTPDTYACGVSGAGVSDLFESLDDDNDFYWGGYSREYWASVIGKKSRDSALIHAASPIEHIDAIKAPLLLIHGDADPTVKYKQSERMNAAMTKAGKDVTFMPMKFMLHGPTTEEQRLTVLKSVDDFIAKAFAKAGKAQ